MIRVAVVDDQPSSRQLLREYLDRFGSEHAVSLAVEEFADGAALTGRFTPVFDVILLDVQMPNLDGFATARLIREVDPSVIIIFVTNMAQLAIKGYEVDALSYLVKPVTYFAFGQEFKRSLRRLGESRDDFLLLPVAGDLVRVNLARVVYVESIKHRLEVHTMDGTLSLVGTLRDMTERLEPRGFVRINSFLLVNLRHVLVFGDQTAVMSQGSRLPVSRSRKREFAEALEAYSGRAPVT